MLLIADASLSNILATLPFMFQSKIQCLNVRKKWPLLIPEHHLKDFTAQLIKDILNLYNSTYLKT